jgi:hypothetical protein
MVSLAIPWTEKLAVEMDGENLQPALEEVTSTSARRAVMPEGI